MKFTQLRLVGFKSFVDPAELKIDPGLTGIIGPNGCGKSNLLEALRWVMGATSAKSLRGGGMEDVIFAGTDNRPSRDKAEVTLHVDNTDKTAPARFNEADTLEVVRRIARGKGSDYRINGEEVRAKDVQLLFADLGTGANSPALVRQGQINELIAAKPENRRRVLEEAAGVAGLRARRREAQLRLNAAEANLDRLQEIVDDLESRHQSLQRQARQASRYRKLSSDIREFEALMWLRRFAEAGEAVARAEAELEQIEQVAEDAIRLAASATTNAEKAQAGVQPLREAEAEASAAERLLERERDALERELDQIQATIARLESRLTDLAGSHTRESELAQEARVALDRIAGSLDRLRAETAGDTEAVETAEAALRHAELARSEAERELDRLSNAAAQARALRDSARRDVEQGRARVDKLEREARAARERYEDFAGSGGPGLDALQADVEAAATAETAAREALAGREAGLETARAAAGEARETARAAEGEALALDREAQSLSRMLDTGEESDRALDSVRADAGFETALAAALGEDLEAGLDADAARRWTEGGVRAGALPTGATPLNAVVDAPDALATRLAAVGVVDEADLDRLASELKPGQRLVTREGALRRWDGFTAEAGAPSPAAARLENLNRLREVEAGLETARTASEAARTEAEQARTALQTAEAGMKTAREALQHAERLHREAERALSQGREVAVRDEARRTALKESAAALVRDLDAAREDLEAAEAHLSELDTGGDDGEALEAARQETERTRAFAAEARAALETVRRESQARRHRIASLEREQSDWSKRAESARARIAAIETETASARTELEAARSRPEEIEARRRVLLDTLAEAESAARLARDRVAQAETAQREADTTLRAAEREASTAREARAAAAATLTAATERRSETAERLEDATGETPEALTVRAASSEYADLSISEIERRLDEARLGRERLGAVNLRADEESEELQSERERLTREHADLMEAVSRLRKAVDTLSREGRARLLEAFEVVDGHFRHLFSTLFGGGRAELHLTESEDPLEAGLEIMACPPGKKLENMSLMSGGEQALTAAALIFAVFLSNPAPVCVLDEVDAPLDDANVDRFCTMLEAMRKQTDTRFLVITHNPVTMARMDRLFGVTMGERGVSQLVSVNLTAAEQMLAAE